MSFELRLETFQAKCLTCADTLKATCKRMFHAAKRDRQTANGIVALQRQSTGSVGLIIADAGNPFFSKIVGPIERATYNVKRSLILCDSDEDPQRERYHLAQLLSYHVDGIIILPVAPDASPIEPYRAHFPIVALDRRLPDANLDLAIVNNVRGGELAVHHFVDLGHKRIAVVAAHHSSINVERIGGFEGALTSRGIWMRPQYVRQGCDARQHTGYEETLYLMRLPEPPTAILVLNHLLTLGAMNAIRDSGLRIPQDVSLIGFDEAPWTGLLDPALTTVSQPAEKLGLAAAALLIDRLDGNYNGPPREVMLEPTLIVRASTAQAADRSQGR